MTHDAGLPTAPRLWTPEDDATLLRLRGQGQTARQIGDVLGRTRRAVLGRGDTLRAATRGAAPPMPEPGHEPVAEPTPPYGVTLDSIGRRYWTPEEDARLADMRRRGRSDPEIGEALGRTSGAVQGRVINLRLRGGDLPPRKRWSRWTPERIASARAMWGEGLTKHQIAHRLGTDATSVARVLRSPEVAEDSPGEAVRVSRTMPDLARAASEVERAEADLARARARQRQAMELVLGPVREALAQVGAVVLPDPEARGDRPEDEPAWRLVDQLRRHGLELRRVA